VDRLSVGRCRLCRLQQHSGTSATAAVISPHSFIPAQAGVQCVPAHPVIPAAAGMTGQQATGLHATLMLFVASRL
jgi:hypothetical protein